MIVWVTGASGKIGRALSASLESDGHEVYGIGRTPIENFTAGPWVTWDPSVEGSAPGELPAPECVFHLAGQTSPATARSNVATDVMANVVTLVRVLTASIEAGALPHVIAAGAATEASLDQFGLAPTGSVAAPATFYETGKSAQRLYLSQFAREGLIDFTVLRLANVYGGGQSSNRDRGFLDQCINSAIHGETVTYFGDGDYSRDYLYLDDAVRAFITTAKSREYTRNTTFDVGTGVSTPIAQSLFEVKDVVEKRLGRVVTLNPISIPQHVNNVDAGDRTVDPTRFQQSTTWVPEVSMRQGIELIVAEYERYSKDEI